jgi:lysozyme
MNNRLLLVWMAGAAALLLLSENETAAGVNQDDAGAEGETVLDELEQVMDQVVGSVLPGPVADMWASDQVRSMLKRRERLRLERYNIGDGGWTIGYGHFEKNIANIPARITVDQAERMFDQDVAERAEKWVRLYVQVPLMQHEFDALVHIAFNMSPQSFKKFASTVNAGQGIGYWAERSINWVGAHLQNGIRNRRNEELALFNEGAYA